MTNLHQRIAAVRLARGLQKFAADEAPSEQACKQIVASLRRAYQDITAAMETLQKAARAKILDQGDAEVNKRRMIQARSLLDQVAYNYI